MNKNPKILEINTRVWIKQFGKNKNLSAIPDSQIDYWKDSGFDLIWFMGIWKNNEETIQEFCFEPELITAYNDALKDWKDDDVIGSPYSIDKYEINPLIGTNDAILQSKTKLNKNGIKLILDFVCNHFSAKSSLIWTK